MEGFKLQSKSREEKDRIILDDEIGLARLSKNKNFAEKQQKLREDIQKKRESQSKEESKKTVSEISEEVLPEKEPLTKENPKETKKKSNKNKDNLSKKTDDFGMGRIEFDESKLGLSKKPEDIDDKKEEFSSEKESEQEKTDKEQNNTEENKQEEDKQEKNEKNSNPEDLNKDSEKKPIKIGSETLFMLKMATTEKIKFMFSDMKENFFLKRNLNKIKNVDVQSGVLQSELSVLKSNLEKEKKEFDSAKSEISDEYILNILDKNKTTRILEMERKIREKEGQIDFLNQKKQYFQDRYDYRFNKINSLRQEYSDKIDLRISIFKKRYEYDDRLKEMEEVREKFKQVEDNIKEMENVINQIQTTLSHSELLSFSDKIKLKLRIRSQKKRIARQQWVKNDLAVTYFDLKGDMHFMNRTIEDYEFFRPKLLSSENNFDNTKETKSEENKDVDVEKVTKVESSKESVSNTGESDNSVDNFKDKPETIPEGAFDSDLNNKDATEKMLEKAKNKIPELQEKIEMIKQIISGLQKMIKTEESQNPKDIIRRLNNMKKDLSDKFKNWSALSDTTSLIDELLKYTNSSDVNPDYFKKIIKQTVSNLNKYSKDLESIIKLSNDKK
ncbi:MAG TPA: hypothetical protein PKE08_00595 [Candidatus Paceibacterota bacterium]|nr:hypothetical protein [Candidatus Paceibacterota bacterium]